MWFLERKMLWNAFAAHLPLLPLFFVTVTYRKPLRGQPPWRGGGALHQWSKRFLKSGGEELTKSWPNPWEQIATCDQCFCAGFGFLADYGFIAVFLWLYSHLFTASQPSIYGFTAVYLRLHSRLFTALWPLPVTMWLHSGTRIGPNWYGLSAGQV